MNKLRSKPNKSFFFKYVYCSRKEEHPLRIHYLFTILFLHLLDEQLNEYSSSL